MFNKKKDNDIILMEQELKRLKREKASEIEEGLQVQKALQMSEDELEQLLGAVDKLEDILIEYQFKKLKEGIVMLYVNGSTSFRDQEQIKKLLC